MNAGGEFWYPSTLCRPVSHATGQAGDVFLCHPFLVHTATRPHCGTGPRMIAQPVVHVPGGFTIDHADPSPIARAIAAGLAQTGWAHPAVPSRTAGANIRPIRQHPPHR